MAAASDGQQSAEEPAVTLQGDPEVLGRDVVALAPLTFEARALFSEHLCQPLHRRRDQMVCLFDGAARFVFGPDGPIVQYEGTGTTTITVITVTDYGDSLLNAPNPDAPLVISGG